MVWYTIYQHLPVVKGVKTPLLINQPMGKGDLWPWRYQLDNKYA
jgi:hypothetical protein